jgi:hypothetical protein
MRKLGRNERKFLEAVAAASPDARMLSMRPLNMFGKPGLSARCMR